jgi:hypothetical protein
MLSPLLGMGLLNVIEWGCGIQGEKSACVTPECCYGIPAGALESESHPERPRLRLTRDPLPAVTRAIRLIAEHAVFHASPTERADGRQPHRRAFIATHHVLHASETKTPQPAKGQGTRVTVDAAAVSAADAASTPS